MANIRVIKTTTGRILIQHSPTEGYSDATLPLPKSDVADQVLTTHEALAAAGVRGSAQLDVVAGQLVIDVSKPALEDQITARCQAAIQKLSQLPNDAAVLEPVRSYLLAIVDILAVGPGELLDPNSPV